MGGDLISIGLGLKADVIERERSVCPLAQHTGNAPYLQIETTNPNENKSQQYFFPHGVFTFHAVIRPRKDACHPGENEPALCRVL